MPDTLRSALDLTRRSDFVYLSTLQDDGCPDTRVMFNLLKLRPPVLALAEDSFATWIGTNTSSQKVAQIRKDPRVCLYYSDTDSFEGLTLRGTVEEIHDLGLRTAVWTEEWNVYYPGGQEGGDFTLLRFQPLRGRYYCGLRVVEFDAEQVR